MKIKTALLLISCLLLSGCSDSKAENSESTNIGSISTATTTAIIEPTTENTTEEYYDIPELVGMKKEEAESILKKYGMKIKYNYEPSPEYAKDYIIRYPHRKYNDEKNEITLTVSSSKYYDIDISKLEINTNSVGGCSLVCDIYDHIYNDISCYYVDFYFYDKYGKDVYCEVENTNHKRVKFVGIPDGEPFYRVETHVLIYNYDVYTVAPKVITLEYPNGLTKTIECTKQFTKDNHFGEEVES